MADINSCSLTGCVGQDPTMKHFESGAGLTSFSIANTEYDFTQKKDVTTWIACKAWGKKAEFIAEYAKKGSFVAVSGKLKIDKWKDQEGIDRVTPYIFVEEIRIFNKNEAKE